MKIAYLILAHRNLTQVAELISLLTFKSPLNHCFLHIDEKYFNNSVLDNLMLLIDEDSCTIIKKPVKINWGGYSMVNATLKLITEAMTSTKDFDYVSLISGSDLPIKSNHYINTCLSKHIDNQYLEFFEVTENSHWLGNGGLERFDYVWDIDTFGYTESRKKFYTDKLLVVKKPRLKHFKSLYGGSQWWTLTSGCLKYVLDFLENNPDVIEYFQQSLIPDEIFFHTIILNSHYSQHVINCNFRFIDWKYGPEYPRILRVSDLSKLTNSTSLFARKFDKRIDASVIGDVKKMLI